LTRRKLTKKHVVCEKISNLAFFGVQASTILLKIDGEGFLLVPMNSQLLYGIIASIQGSSWLLEGIHWSVWLTDEGYLIEIWIAVDLGLADAISRYFQLHCRGWGEGGSSLYCIPCSKQLR